MRSYPAIDVTWSDAPGADVIDRLMAELDETSPTAIETHPHALRVFFTTESDRDEALYRVATFAPEASVARVSVPDESWAERSQQSLSAVRIARVVVAPPWIPRPDTAASAEDNDSIWITIEPSMGFGTGHHPTTRLCLQLLQRVPVTGAVVLDAGTGSGVLAIAAWRLGASHVAAIDFDRDAIQCAAENVERNGATAGVSVRVRDLAQASAEVGPVDGVVANLTGGLIVREAATLAALMRPGGWLVVSGFQRDEAEGVLRALTTSGVRLVHRIEEHEWVALGLSGRQHPA
jgi:ribosomal protein L11 methyltransferase